MPVVRSLDPQLTRRSCICLPRPQLIHLTICLLKETVRQRLTTHSRKFMSIRSTVLVALGSALLTPIACSSSDDHLPPLSSNSGAGGSTAGKASVVGAEGGAAGAAANGGGSSSSSSGGANPSGGSASEAGASGAS